jgi:hypothetical protein
VKPTPVLGWLAGVALACAAIVLGRLVFDLGRLHVAIALCVGAFYLPGRRVAFVHDGRRPDSHLMKAG